MHGTSPELFTARQSEKSINRGTILNSNDWLLNLKSQIGAHDHSM